MAGLNLNLGEMIARCRQYGSHYFDPETVSFWGAKIHDTPNRWGLFVESYDNFDRTKKLYAVKFFAPNAQVTVIEPAEIGKTYEHFPTLAAARKFRDKLTRALTEATECYRENIVLRSLNEIEEEGLNSGIFILRNEQGDYIKINTNNFDRFICG